MTNDNIDVGSVMEFEIEETGVADWIPTQFLYLSQEAHKIVEVSLYVDFETKTLKVCQSLDLSERIKVNNGAALVFNLPIDTDFREFKDYYNKSIRPDVLYLAEHKNVTRDIYGNVECNWILSAQEKNQLSQLTQLLEETEEKTDEEFCEETDEEIRVNYMAYYGLTEFDIEYNRITNSQIKWEWINEHRFQEIESIKRNIEKYEISHELEGFESVKRRISENIIRTPKHDFLIFETLEEMYEYPAFSCIVGYWYENMQKALSDCGIDIMTVDLENTEALKEVVEALTYSQDDDFAVLENTPEDIIAIIEEAREKLAEKLAEEEYNSAQNY